MTLIQARQRAGEKKLMFNEYLLYAKHEVRAWHVPSYGTLKIILTRNFTHFDIEETYSKEAIILTKLQFQMVCVEWVLPLRGKNGWVWVTCLLRFWKSRANGCWVVLPVVKEEMKCGWNGAQWDHACGARWSPTKRGMWIWNQVGAMLDKISAQAFHI